MCASRVRPPQILFVILRLTVQSNEEGWLQEPPSSGERSRLKTQSTVHVEVCVGFHRRGAKRSYVILMGSPVYARELMCAHALCTCGKPEMA